MSASRRFFVETWGCQMNELDSQRLSGLLMQEGLLPTRNPGDADLILLNSCSVREKAEQKVYSRLGEYRQFKRTREALKIGLCGCVAQEAGRRALTRVPDLDLVLGPARVGEIRGILARLEQGERIVATGFPETRRYDFDAVARDGSHKGMVTIIEGCNKSCTFCIVPMTRGPERCRSMTEILTEVEHLVDYGFLEIELLGQTVNHWRDPASSLDFADLLRAVAETPGVERLRFVTSYPRDFTPRMVDQIGHHSNICPYVHLPVQSGADSVLRRMGRGYTIQEYRQLIESLRDARPEMALSTDLIVGFPGETDEEFAATMRLVEDLEFSSIFAFKYSPRPGTAAPRLGPPIEEAIADDRLQRLLARQQRIQSRLNRSLEGSTRQVLVTGWGRKPGTLTGRTTCHRIVHFPAEEEGSPTALGTLTTVRIEQALPHSLLGRAIASPAT